MLRPSLIVNAVVDALRTIQPLVTSMAGDAERIVAFHYMQGQESSLAEAINRMLQPSILVCWAGTMGGNFDGQTIWRHQIDIYFRTPNVANLLPALAYEDVWWQIVNLPVNGSDVPYLNLRNVQLLPGQLDIMNTPSVTHMTDEENQDFFVGHCTWNEIGDTP